MKWTAIATLCAAPVVLAGSVRDLGLARRDGGIDLAARTPKDDNNKDGNNHKSNKDNNNNSNNNNSGSSTTEIIIIWENGGGASATTTINSASSTANAAIATHSVTVGGDAGLVYTPETIQAAVGDMVVFNFETKNHTVTQSSFTEPCVAINQGMSSGFVPNINNTVNPAPQQAFQVLVDTPLWFYCEQTGHCGKGMVFSINPSANKTHDAFKAAAIAQNGTVAAATTTAAASSAATSSVATTLSSVATSVASSTASASSSSASIASGTGTTNSDGSCSCSCLCGVENFPAGTQGLLAVGGFSGAMPQSALEISG